MRFQPELERLATLDADTIDRACSTPECLPDLIGTAVDEYLAFDEYADAHFAAGDIDEATLCRQEAAAWRATVAVLRSMSRMPGHANGEVGAA
ncbi:hypothetical protein AAFP35_05065 [Gordonia sp. CPCC 206044]|uniref:hypothetical protein n=1 Tax=Gordonia sp. CPCC 206044 TaxID=3140793 RepID=UPI003AF3A156